MSLPVKYILLTLFLLPLKRVTAFETPLELGKLNFPTAEKVTENTIRIPFQLVDHLIVIKAGANGRTGNFIIDTGAETLVLNSVHFKNYNRKRYRTTAGVNSVVDKTYMKTLDSLLLQTFSIDAITADVINLSAIEKSKNISLYGIIGYKILKEYEVFIDFYLKQITLFKTDTHGNRIDTHALLEKVTDTLPFRQKNHTIILDAVVNGEKLIFGLDSGAEINHLSSSVSKKVLEKFVVMRRVKMMGAGGHKREVIAGKLYGVKFSDAIYNGTMRTLLAHLGEMKNAYGTHLDGIVGYEFLVNRRIIINYKKEKLYFIEYPHIQNE